METEIARFSQLTIYFSSLFHKDVMPLIRLKGAFCSIFFKVKLGRSLGKWGCLKSHWELLDGRIYSPIRFRLVWRLVRRGRSGPGVSSRWGVRIVCSCRRRQCLSSRSRGWCLFCRFINLCFSDISLIIILSLTKVSVIKFSCNTWRSVDDA